MLEAKADDYYGQMLALRPKGPAWPEDDAMLSAQSVEFARVHGRANALREEADPRTAYEMLPAWERNLGLPDECCTDPTALTVEERRRRAYQKWVSLGGASIPYFLEIAADLGHPGATIQNFWPFTANSKCTDPLNPAPWSFVWKITIQERTTVTRMTCQSPCTSPLRSWGDDQLECVLRQLQPSESHLIFSYVGEDLPRLPPFTANSKCDDALGSV